jgi:hypothetical protein
MMIQVFYNTGTHDMVKPETLNNLLVNGVIAQFKRSTGWVKVGRDRIRNIPEDRYPESFDRRHRAD